jgi:protein involved in ribonucleotide reduction
LRQVLPQKIFYQKTDKPIVALHDLNINYKECTETIHELNADSAKEIVENKVSEFINENSKTNKIIAGISGGGDSNTLVRSLKKQLQIKR